MVDRCFGVCVCVCVCVCRCVCVCVCENTRISDSKQWIYVNERKRRQGNSMGFVKR